MHRPDDAPWSRPDGYAEAYANVRFQRGSGPRTHRREARILDSLLSEWRALETRTPSNPTDRSVGRWLDVPSGAGRWSGHLPGPVVCVDRDPKMLAEADARLPNVTTVRATALQLPFEDRSFEGALCFRLLHHLAKPEERLQVLNELRRVVRGPLLFSFFDKHSVQHLRRVVRRRFGKKRSSRNGIAKSTLRAELELAGFELIRWQGLSPYISEQWIGLARPRR
ncbi:MAG: class I SAM-dependent methyltransferase [Planctomycetota bacterium]